jgi:hypothetical protein
MADATVPPNLPRSLVLHEVPLSYAPGGLLAAHEDRLVFCFASLDLKTHQLTPGTPTSWSSLCHEFYRDADCEWEAPGYGRVPTYRTPLPDGRLFELQPVHHKDSGDIWGLWTYGAGDRVATRLKTCVRPFCPLYLFKQLSADPYKVAIVTHPMDTGSRLLILDVRGDSCASPFGGLPVSVHSGVGYDEATGAVAFTRRADGQEGGAPCEHELVVLRPDDSKPHLLPMGHFSQAPSVALDLGKGCWLFWNGSEDAFFVADLGVWPPVAVGRSAVRTVLVERLDWPMSGVLLGDDAVAVLGVRYETGASTWSGRYRPRLQVLQWNAGVPSRLELQLLVEASGTDPAPLSVFSAAETFSGAIIFDDWRIMARPHSDTVYLGLDKLFSVSAEEILSASTSRPMNR